MIFKKLLGYAKTLFKSRFSALLSVLSLYIILSFLIRIAFLICSSADADFNPFYILRAFLTGFLYDLAMGSMFLFLYAAYLLVFPKRWIGSVADKAFTYFYLTLIFIIIYFSLMAEIPLWDEFGVRFNFIAVDYLIYTYEVVENINQSYPLSLMAGVLISVIILTFICLKKLRVFKNTFSDKRPISARFTPAVIIILIGSILGFLMSNKQADFSNNLVVNEIGKNGAFSFISAYQSNELDYKTFYPKLSDKEAYSALKASLLQENQNYETIQADDISRITKGGQEQRPNIIVITIESFSADFLKEFGNKDHLTPNYDELTTQSIFFTNLYATGTRTVRGMEALTLCVPPTPGNSIVRRSDNDKLFSVQPL